MANLIGIPLKRSKQVEFQKAISNYLDRNYADDPNAHPKLLNNDIQTLHKMRSTLVIPLGVNKPDVHPAVLRDLSTYFAQLAFFSTKFNADIGLDFPWYAIYDTQGISSLAAAPLPGFLPSQQPISLASITYERCSILFNIAAMYCLLGSIESRADVQGIKRSISYFQSAAGCFEHLSNNLLPQIKLSPNVKQPVSPELSKEALAAFSTLALAQAQECSWQKAVLDQLKNGTIAKLAMQVSTFYAEAILMATSSQGKEAWPIFGFPSAVMNHLKIKRAQFEAIAHFRRSMDDLAANRYGDEVARLQLAQKQISFALSMSKRDILPAVLDDVKGLQGVVADNLARAVKDNDLIYLEIVKAQRDLPQITPAAIVKASLPAEIDTPIDFLFDGQGGFGKPLFSTLVPYTVQLAMSIYDSRKENLLKAEMLERSEQLDAECSSTLQTYDLPAALQALDAPFGLPAGLLSKAEQVRAESGPVKIRTMLRDIDRLRVSNRNILQECFAILSGEEVECEQLRSQARPEIWTLQPSVDASLRQRNRVNKLTQTLDQAATSDGIVLQKYETWSDKIERMAGSQADMEAVIPTASSSKPTWFAAPQPTVHQHAAVRQLRTTLERLDGLAQDRRSLSQEVRRLVANDDIRSLVLREAGNLAGPNGNQTVQTAQFEPLIASQLAKYRIYQDRMQQNANQQDALLVNVEAENDAFTAAKAEDETSGQRQQVLQEFDVAFSKYREITSNLTEGLKFYNDLSTMLAQLHQECQAFYSTRLQEAHAVVTASQQSRQIQPGRWDAANGIRFAP